MQNFIFSANIVFPLFVIILVGYLMKRIGIVKDAFISVGDRLTFVFLLPTILFNGIYDADLQAAFNLKLVLFVILTIVGVNLIGYLIVPIVVKDNARRGTIIQSWMRSNYILIGIPIAQAIYGAEGVTAVSLIAAIYVPTVNFFAVLALSIFGEGKRNIKDLLTNVFKNPFILTIIAALIINFLGIKLPSILDTSLDSFASMATPFALFLLGAGFNLKSVRGNLKAIATGVAMKLFVLPLIILYIAYLLGFRDLEFCLILTAFASPIAVSSYIMAKIMHCDHELASQLIVVTTLLSSVSIFLFITVSRVLHLM